MIYFPLSGNSRSRDLFSLRFLRSLYFFLFRVLGVTENLVLIMAGAISVH